MDSPTINILLASFPGLNLPSTLSIPLPASTPISTFISQLNDRLPSLRSRLILTTTSNTQITPSPHPISTLLPHHATSNPTTILPLRLSAPLCAGKGGFGSQLRAAGGRMSSHKKKNLATQASSSRNLDGRRLRTVAEAKALAEYLALKPEMEKKEKDERRKRWEQVVEAAERREEEVRSGSGARGRVLDGRLGEEREEIGERARMAVKAAMAVGGYHDSLGGGVEEDDESGGQDGEGEEDEEEVMEAAEQKKSVSDSAVKAKAMPSRVYFGFDEEDEFMSDGSEDEEEGGVALATPASAMSKSVRKGKGKAKLRECRKTIDSAKA